MDSVCRVAVSAAKYAFDRLYDYDIPPELRGQVQPGVRVLVPFGSGSRTCEAIVVRMGKDAKSDYERKAVSRVLDTEPVMDEAMLKLAAHLCSTLFCSFFDCARAMLPAGLWFRRISRYTLADSITEQKRAELAQSEPVLSAFTKRKRTLSEKELHKRFGTLPAEQLDALCQRGILTFSSEFDRRIGDKTVTMYALALPEDEARQAAERGRSPVRMDVVSALIHEGRMNRHDLRYLSGASDAVLRAMVKSGMLLRWEEETCRLPEVSEPPAKRSYVLSEEQQRACDALLPRLHTGRPEAALLFGVTGSGKTLVYLRLIEETLRTGKSAIVLVPEIGLTPQLIQRFMAHFGGCTAVLHSALSVGERYDSWKRIRSGEARVIVGTRSAIFAPARDLGLIILDEEQDDAYKSENTPRYHARDVAKYRAMQENCLVVFGSATPSIETYYGAECEKYPMIKLRERFAGTRLPEVTIADMRGLTRQGFTSAVGPVLRQAMENCLQQGKQCILFLNRRGAARQVVCTACGWTPECPSCSVSMTYHSVNHRVMCHYCGHSQPLAHACPVCGSTHLKTDGVGTQRLEQDLHELFPEAAVLRMDADTTAAKGAHAKLLGQFAAGEADILIGTQMVTKGLDFDNVALVGIIDADQSLFAQDYRARERTFSLLTQVVGRAGRRDTRGQAVIQTYCPEHTVILNAARQDYEQFYREEIELRRALQCPPAAQIVVLTASAERERDVLEALVAVKMRLESLMAGQFADFCYPVLGPAPAPVVRVQNRYRYHLSIRCPEGKRRRMLIGGVLREFASNSKFRSVALYADVNPLQL
ncbi:MAG TPA: primosomal protein N' [Clostridiales bacterium]|nr:primosomal protein N' [Clostridiales bacterium]